MRVRFLLDEHLSPAIAEQLRTRGIDAVAVAERPDLRTGSDPQILEVAAAEGRVLVTRNIVDFVPLDGVWAAAGRPHAGILCVAMRRFPDGAALVGALVAALASWADTGRDIAGTYAFL